LYIVSDATVDDDDDVVVDDDDAINITN